MKNTVILVFLLILSILLRWNMNEFFLIDKDESTHINIGYFINQGYILYKDVWAIRPMPIFYLSAFLQKLFSSLIEPMRILGSLSIGLSSFYLYRIMRFFKKKDDNELSTLSCLVPSFIYIAFTVYYPDTHAINLEILYNSLNIIGIFHFLRRNSSSNSAKLFPLLLGLSFTFKYTNLFLFLSLLALDLIQDNKKGKVARVVPSLFIFSVPFLVFVFIFSVNHSFELIFSEHFLKIIQYGKSHSLSNLINTVKNVHMVFTEILVLFYLAIIYLLLDKKRPEEFIFLGFSFFGLALASLLPGKHWAYPSVSLFPILVIPLGLVSYSEKINKKYFLSVVSLILLAFTSYSVSENSKRYSPQNDKAKKVSLFLKQINPSSFYIFSGRLQILDAINGAKPLSKYIHRTALFRSYHQKVHAIDVKKAFENIFSNEPEVLVLREKHLNAPIPKDKYIQFHKIEDVYFFKRIN